MISPLPPRAPTSARWPVKFRTLAAAALITLGASCKDSHSPAEPEAFAPGQPILLSVGSPTKDEDPSVLLAHDGTIFVATDGKRVWVRASGEGEERRIR